MALRRWIEHDFSGVAVKRQAEWRETWGNVGKWREIAESARDLGSRIVLIDGLQLARLMIRYNVGCRDEDVLHLKRMDEDFFDA